MSYRHPKHYLEPLSLVPALELPCLSHSSFLWLWELVISIACAAIIARLNASNHDGQFMWTIHWLAAAKTGFAGSLSTVSTFVKEIVDINERYSGRKARYIYYGIGTIICCCLLSLSIYSPLVRLWETVINRCPILCLLHTPITLSMIFDPNNISCPALVNQMTDLVIIICPVSVV